MPIFTENVDFDLQIGPQEFLEQCTDEDIEELVSLLKENHPEYLDSEYLAQRSVGEQEFEATINALHGKWNMLSSEEEEAIRNVAKRFL